MALGDKYNIYSTAPGYPEEETRAPSLNSLYFFLTTNDIIVTSLDVERRADFAAFSVTIAHTEKYIAKQNKIVIHMKSTKCFL